MKNKDVFKNQGFTNRMSHMILTFQIPNDKILSRMSQKFGSFRFSLQSMSLISNKKGICLLQLNNPPQSMVENFGAFMTSINNSKIINVVFQSPELVLFSVTIENPWILLIITRLQLVLRFPIIIENGQMKIEIISERNMIDEFLSEFEKKSIKFKIKRIGRYHYDPILTERQVNLLKYLLDTEFFEIPRKISYHEVATKFGVSTAAISESIRRIFKKLGKSYFETLQI